MPHPHAASGSQGGWYTRFIKWTQDTFKSGGHQAELIPLLERCTRELQDLPRYKDDARYLRVWVQYVRPPLHACPYSSNLFR